MNSYFDIGLLLGLWAAAAITQRYMICAGMVFVLMIIDIWFHSLDNSLLLCVGILLLCWMIMKDTLKNKDEALALKYNPLYEKNQLNPRVRLCVLIVFGVAFVIRVIAFLAFHR